MTMDLGPFCVHCGRPTRFSMNDVYQCKQGCEQAAAEAEAGAQAMGNFQAARAELEAIGRRTTIAAPAPPSLELTGSPEHVLEVLEEHPELDDTVPVVEETPEPEPEPAPVVVSTRPAKKRRRR